MFKFFKLKESGSNPRTEIIAGITTFFTMAYIIFVNPDILSTTGMDRSGVAVATIIASVIGTLILGLVANVPYAAAPGMGLNAFFAFVVCGAMGFTWQEALAMVFICGIINIIITVTRIRKAIIKSIPHSLQNAVGGGIGLFIAYIGMKQAGFLVFQDTAPGITLGSQVVPALAEPWLPKNICKNIDESPVSFPPNRNASANVSVDDEKTVFTAPKPKQTKRNTFAAPAGFKKFLPIPPNSILARPMATTLPIMQTKIISNENMTLPIPPDTTPSTAIVL